MGNWKRTIAIGVSGYLFFLLITFPVSVALPLINQRLPNNTVVLQEPQGTIWAGSIDLSIRALSDRAPLHFAWDYRFLKLLLGQLGVDFKVEGPELDLKGHLAQGVGLLELDIHRGKLGASWINQALAVQGVQIESPISIKGVRWHFALDEQVTQLAEGDLNWPGGLVTVKQPAGDQYQLPAIKGQLSANDNGNLLVNIIDGQSKKMLIKGELLPTGWLKIRLLKRVMGLVGMGRASDPDSQLLEIQHKLF